MPCTEPSPAVSPTHRTAISSGTLNTELRAANAAAFNMSELSVDVLAGTIERDELWHDLLRRAPPNVFMDPAAANAAIATGVAKIITLVAREGETLRGVWTMGVTRPLPIAGAVLTLPPYEYAFLSNPVIDREHTQAVAQAFIRALAGRRDVPQTLRLRYLDGDEASYTALVEAFTAQGARVHQLGQRERAFAWRDHGVKKSGSTRKKLRQDRNRLAALGELDYRNDRNADVTTGNFEIFLAMEAASWKGKNGTAILSSRKDAEFSRRFISELATAGSASVAMLTLNGKPVATQVLLYSGGTAYTWKIAYDADYGRYSPGILLVDSVTEELFGTEGINAVESCSPDGSFMETMWTGRRQTIDLLVQLRGKTSWTFVAMRTWAAMRQRLKELKARALTALSTRRKKRATPASS